MNAMIDRSPAWERTASASLRRICCCLTGGATQHAATAVALDLARATEARLTALAGVDPFHPATPKQSSPLLGFWRSFRGEVDSGAMRDAARCAIEDFEDQVGRKGGAIAIDHVAAGGVWPRFCSLVAGHDIAVVPAGVGADGRRETYDREAAARLATASNTPVLRVSRRPLSIERVLVVLDNTARCRRLAHTVAEVGLWPDARLTVLPVGCDRPIVDEIVRAQADHLDRSGRWSRVCVLAPLPLDFEAPDLIDFASGFQVAVMGHLSNRIGLFDTIRNDVHEVVASVVPMVLLPAC